MLKSILSRVSLCLMLLAFWNAPGVSACEICFYGSLAGCDDHCALAWLHDDLTDSELVACFQCCDAACGSGSDPGGGTEEDIGGTSPILIDLDGGGLHLTDSANGVVFDINADGEVDLISWTPSGSGDAWLVMDRNGSGVIENGRELFGDSTPLLSGGQAAHGFEALAEFDSTTFGGNSDGVLDEQDAFFRRLLVWVDGNHNGLSEATELSTLAEAGITRLEYHFVEQRRRDGNGNEFRFRGRAWLSHQGHDLPAEMYDVFLVLY